LPHRPVFPTRRSSDLLALGDGELWGVPTATGTFNVTVTVTDAASVTATNTFPLKVVGMLQPVSLSSATRNVPYSQRIRVIGGTQDRKSTRVNSSHVSI